MSHATVTELTTWLPADADPGEDADRLLARASQLVDDAVRAAYSVDDTGQPVDTTIAAALRDATCATVEAWLETGEENDLDGLAGTQMSVPGYSGYRAIEVCPRARRALSQVGLLQPADTTVTW